MRDSQTPSSNNFCNRFVISFLQNVIFVLFPKTTMRKNAFPRSWEAVPTADQLQRKAESLGLC
jgi:hypothetical protein